MNQKSQYTVRATEAIQDAFSAAGSRGNPEVTPSHLVLALLQQDEGIAPKLLAKVGASSAQLTGELMEALDRLPRSEGGAEPQPSRSFREVLEQAQKLAPQFQDEYISVEHLLLAIAGVPGSSANKILSDNGVTKDVLLAAIQELRGSHRVTDENPEAKFEALKNYGRDLTELAEAGKLDPRKGIAQARLDLLVGQAACHAVVQEIRQFFEPVRDGRDILGEPVVPVIPLHLGVEGL